MGLKQWEIGNCRFQETKLYSTHEHKQQPLGQYENEREWRYSECYKDYRPDISSPADVLVEKVQQVLLSK